MATETDCSHVGDDAETAAVGVLPTGLKVEDVYGVSKTEIKRARQAFAWDSGRSVDEVQDPPSPARRTFAVSLCVVQIFLLTATNARKTQSIGK